MKIEFQLRRLAAATAISLALAAFTGYAADPEYPQNSSASPAAVNPDKANTSRSEFQRDAAPAFEPGRLGLLKRASELLGHSGAPVPAVRSKSPVTQLLCHKVRPQIVDLKNHSMSCWLVGKTVARQVRYHNVERILGPPAKRCGVGEHRNYFHESQKRIGIAVGENNRERIRAFTPFVNEVDTDAVDFCPKVRTVD